MERPTRCSGIRKSWRATPGPAMLEIDNIRAGYGAINVLWDVTLSVAKGQLTTIIGPNGAGKTTLLRAIMGLLPVNQGGIRYDGKLLSGTSTWDCWASAWR